MSLAGPTEAPLSAHGWRIWHWELQERQLLTIRPPSADDDDVSAVIGEIQLLDRDVHTDHHGFERHREALVSAGHRPGYQVAAHLAGCARRNRRGEEEPDVRSRRAFGRQLKGATELKA